MSAKKPPRLLRSDLTGRIYVTTSYVQKRSGQIVSSVKYDVTADFEAIEAERATERWLGGWRAVHDAGL